MPIDGRYLWTALLIIYALISILEDKINSIDCWGNSRGGGGGVWISEAVSIYGSWNFLKMQQVRFKTLYY